MGVKKKEHRKKIAKRNELVKQNKKKMEKIHRDMIMSMIEEEKKKGLFENNPQVPKFDDINTLGGPSF